MNLKSILDKIKPTKGKSQAQTVMVQPEAVYASSNEEPPAPLVTSTQNGDWESALELQLKSEGFKGNKARIILGSTFYQTYQIEKPEVPESEWPVALPFLLKDLISEKVTEIVANAVALPTSNKLQVYVLPKKILNKLVHISNESGVELECVVPEDEIWGHAAGELSNFILLQRSKNGHFKLGAYVEHTVCFQRTIRSVTPPLTGVASSALQLDGLALELQRSIDYLSSQIKGTQLHQLKICCDEEDEEELQNVLNDTLSSQVSRLTEVNRESSGSFLIAIAETTPDTKVNLYPTHLRPKKEYFTLANVVGSWLAIIIVSLSSYAYVHFEAESLNKKLVIERAESRSLNQQVSQLKAELVQHKPSPEKVAAVARLKREIQSKQDALTAVGEYDESQKIGYSGVMTALAQLGRNDISVSHIYMSSDTLDLAGYARNADVIPNWVGQFKGQMDLVGRAFETLKIGRTEQDIITFELRTRREKQ